MQSRRDFLGTGLTALGAAAVWDPRTLLVKLPAVAPKKILILGGTGFIGPHDVRYALSRGHQVTMTRGGPLGAAAARPECSARTSRSSRAIA